MIAINDTCCSTGCYQTTVHQTGKICLYGQRLIIIDDFDLKSILRKGSNMIRTEDPSLFARPQNSHGRRSTAAIRGFGAGLARRALPTWIYRWRNDVLACHAQTQDDVGSSGRKRETDSSPYVRVRGGEERLVAFRRPRPTVFGPAGNRSQHRAGKSH